MRSAFSHEHYELGELIASGGFGSVWSARDRHHPERSIAIKLIDLEDARAAASFRSEARTLAKLIHPHILRVYDAWDEPFRGVIVMELLRGSTLTARVADGALSPVDALRYLIPVCEALDYAHRRGIVHRDISPNNVFLTTSDDDVKLFDFGLAATAGRDGVIAGTLAFVAPEQIEKAAVDPRSDLYAFGAMLYYVLTGRTLVDTTRSSSNSELLEKKREFTPRSIPDGPLAEILAALLAPYPEHRYQTANGLLHDLRAAHGALLHGDTSRVSATRRREIALILPEFVRPVGRDDVRARVRERFDELLSARGALVQIHGPSGSGKSRIASVVVEEARECGAVIFSGGGIEIAQSMPYGPWREALEDLDSQLASSDELRAWVSMASKSREAQLLTIAPRLSPYIELPAEPDAAKAGLTQAKVIAGVVEFFSQLSRQCPIVIWLDDVQWMDDSSARLLQALAEHVGSHSMLLLLSYRDEGIPKVTPIAARMRGARLDVSPTPLSEKDVAELLPAILGRSVAGVHQAAAIVTSAAEGNAFSVWEVCRGLVAEGAFSFGEGEEIQWHEEIARRVLARVTPAHLLAGRIGRISAQAQGALARAAVWGRVFSAEAAEASEAVLAEALDVGLIERDGANYRFTHDRVLASADALLSAEQRRPLHLRAAKRRVREGKEGYALAVAHFVEAGALEQAGQAALEAARVAKEMFAIDTAVSFYLQALAWARSGECRLSQSEFADLLYLVGGIALDAGKYAVGKAMFAEWMERASAEADSAKRARAYRGQAFASFALEDPHESIRLFRLALVELSEDLPVDTWGCARVITGSLADLCTHWLRGPAARAHIERQDPRVAQAGHVYLILWNSAAELDTRWSLTALLRGLAITSTLPPCRERGVLMSTASVLAAFLPPILRPLCFRASLAGMAMAEQRGDKYAQYIGHIALGRGYMISSQWKPAFEEFAAVTEADPRLVDPHLVGIAYGEQLLIRIGEGDIVDGVRIGKRALRFQERIEDHAVVTLLRALTAYCLGATGKIDEADALAATCVETTRRAQNTLQLVVSLAVQGDLHRRRGKLEMALALSREAVDIAVNSHVFTLVFGLAYAVYFETLAQAAEAGSSSAASHRASWIHSAPHALLTAAAYPGCRALIVWSLARVLWVFPRTPGVSRMSPGLYRLAAQISERTGAGYAQARALRDSALLDLRANQAAPVDVALRALALLDQCGAQPEADALRSQLGALRPDVMDLLYPDEDEDDLAGTANLAGADTSVAAAQSSGTQLVEE